MVYSGFSRNINRSLENFLSENQSSNPPVPKQVILDFISRFQLQLSNNISEYWLVFPLTRANVDTLVEFADYVIIPEKFTREKKIDYLANLISISKDEMSFRADHTENSRSPDFYNFTLFCHKVSHYPYWVSTNASRLALLDVALLRTITNSANLADQKSYGLMLEDRRELLINMF